MGMEIEVGAVITLSNAPKGFLDKLMLANRHDNPEYVQAKKFGYDMSGLEPYQLDYEYDKVRNVLTIPRGIFNRFRLDGVEHSLTRNTVKWPIFLPETGIKLRNYQDVIFTQAGDKEEGVVVAPTGAGKTIIGMELIERKQQKTLILVHTKELLKQWVGEVEKFFGFTPGLVNDKQADVSKPITVAMIQSGYSDLDKLQADKFGLTLVDECHHVPAQTFARVLDAIPSHFRYGLSATPKRSDGLEKMLFNRIGPVISQISKDLVEKEGGIVPAKVTVIKTGIKPTYSGIKRYTDKKTKQVHERKVVDKPVGGKWGDYLTALTQNEARNQFIANTGLKSSKVVPTLILVDRIEHAEAIYERSGGLLLHGKMKDAERDAAMQAALSAPLTIGTTGLLGEGINVSGWGNLILGSPISGDNRLLQAIGRVIRTSDGKTCGYITDLVDDCRLAYSSLNKRLAIYAERRYPVSTVEIDVGSTPILEKKLDLTAIREKEIADRAAHKLARDAEKAAERRAIDERKRHRAEAKALRDDIKREKAELRERQKAIKANEQKLKEVKAMTMKP